MMHSDRKKAIAREINANSFAMAALQRGATRVLFSNAEVQDFITALMPHCEEILVFCRASEFFGFRHPWATPNVKCLVADPIMINKDWQPDLFNRFNLVVNYRAPTLGGPDIPDDAMARFVMPGGHLCSIERSREGWTSITFKPHLETENLPSLS